MSPRRIVLMVVVLALALAPAVIGKFAVSLLKAMYGDKATAENDWAFDYLPKVDRNYSWTNIWDNMYRGNVKVHLRDSAGATADHAQALALDRGRFALVMIQQLASGAAREKT